MSNNMHNRNESHTSLVSLPIELIIHILQEVYVPWTATMSLTCQLAPIPNIALLRTCSLFNFHGITAIHSAFSGEFVRHDRRGCIIDANLEPRKWYSWIMANTRTLNLHDAYFTIWYIPTYWQFYPRLKRFVLSIGQESTYNDPTIEMPDFEDRRRRCDQRTGTLIKRDYSFHGYLFDELFVSIFKDMQKAGGRQWPEVEYRFWDCRCHPKRQTVLTLQHQDDIGDKDAQELIPIDEYFISTLYHVEDGLQHFKHEAWISCVTLPNDYGFAKNLRAVGICSVNGKARTFYN